MPQPTGFMRSTPTGQVFARAADGATVTRTPEAIGMLGESAIGKSDQLRGQAPERVFRGAPQFWRVTNRAQHGHVKVWMGAFNGEVYPEGATEDKRTWLQPGESMMLSIDAGLHFLGNVFDPRAPEAADVIERNGGLELETEAKQPGNRPQLRVVGGPIGLPDFVVEPINGRQQRVGQPVSVYELYWGKLKRSGILHRASQRDPEQRAVEAELLQQRIAEYTLDDMPLYDDTGAVASTATSREEAALADEPDMRAAFGSADDDSGAHVDDEVREIEPEPEKPAARRGR